MGAACKRMRGAAESGLVLGALWAHVCTDQGPAKVGSWAMGVVLMLAPANGGHVDQATILTAQNVHDKHAGTHSADGL